METLTSRLTPGATLGEPPAAVAAVRQIGDGFKAFQVLRAGYATGLFDWLDAHGPAERGAIAEALGLRGAHLGAFLQALEDLGLLVRHEEGHAVAPGLADVLCARGGWHQLEALERLVQPESGWSDLPGFMSEDWVPPAQRQTSSLRLHPLLGEARRLADHLATRWAGSSASPPSSLLCLDGGDGLLAVALCEREENLQVTVVVSSESLPHAEAMIAQSGLQAGCRVVAGSPLEPPGDEVFAHVVLFHSLYSIRKATTEALAAVATRVAPGGELCSAHWFCREACESGPGGLRELDRAVLTDSHPLCHVERFGERLEQAGLVPADQADLAGEYGTTRLHFARSGTVPV